MSGQQIGSAVGQLIGSYFGPVGGAVGAPIGGVLITSVSAAALDPVLEISNVAGHDNP